MANTLNFKIVGGKKLHGTIDVNSSKNGAVSIICASLMNRGVTTLTHVPKIEEVNRLVEVLRSIGVGVELNDKAMIITPPAKLTMKKIDTVSAGRTRIIALFAGILVHTLQSFDIPQAGGCKLGSRTVRPHLYALEKFGIDISISPGMWHVSHTKLVPAEVVMYESGDTATINAILAASGIEGESVIKYASANYQVQDLCFFLQELGVKIEGIGTTTLTVRGKKIIDKKIEYAINEDPIDAMFYIATAIVTKSAITIRRCPIDFLELELLVLEKMGFKYTILKKYKGRGGHMNLADIETMPSKLVAAADKIHARPYPGLNMDNLPFFAVIATQAKGTTLIHDWVYEKRALYFTELDKLGGTTLLADPHRIYVTGVTKLHSADLVCPPALRPATILLIAMLAAPGTSMLRNIYSINRGYEGLASKLSSLGAQISVAEEKPFEAA